MPIIGPDYAVDLAIGDYPTMEKSLAVQIAEASLMSWVIDNSEGVVTVIRAHSQKDSAEDRLKCFYFFANDCWYAINQPGKEENVQKWTERLETRLLKAFFNAYHRQICAAGILERDVKVKVPEDLIGEMNRLKKKLKFIGITDLTEAVDLLFEKYGGNTININSDEDSKKVLNAMLLYNDVDAKLLDTSEKARSYAINNNVAKRWCPIHGISASTDDLPARYETIIHKRVIRHSCQTFFRKAV